VLLAYVDESQSKERYWIAGLVCPDREAASLTAALDAAVGKASQGYAAISGTAERHGHALFQGKDDWAPLATMPRARIGVYSDAFAAIPAHDVKIFVRGVHVHRLNERYVYPDYPYSVVLGNLLERLDEYAATQNEWVLVIADEVDRADVYRRNLWIFQRFSTGGYRARQLTRIVDTIHFAPSRASRLVQAADLVAYLWQRIQSRAERDERAKRANWALWRQVSPRVVTTHCWFP